MGFRLRVLALVLLLAGDVAAATTVVDWQRTLTTGGPGTFPRLRPLTATYHFGWAGFTAATGEVRITEGPDDRFQLDGSGHTIGLVRALWKMDATQHAVSDATTLRPITVEQMEKIRSKTMVTKLTFNASGVTRTRQEVRDGAEEPKVRQFEFPNLFDLHSAMLYVRSQSLADRSVQRIVVYPASSAYLATITVIGHEKVSIRAGSFEAIKLDLQLSKVGKNNQLEPHRKFRRATVWVSDDRDRLLLKIDAQIFVGSVFAELQSVRFDEATK
jgi:hypothetical protein